MQWITSVESEIKGRGVPGRMPGVEASLADLAEVPNCCATILLLEDDRELSEITCRVLESRGYTVLVAEDAVSGMRCFDENGSRIQLLVADMSAPGMNRFEISKRLAERGVEVKTIFIADGDDRTLEEERPLQDCAYIRKPFTVDTLARKVREMIDGVSYPEDVKVVN